MELAAAGMWPLALLVFFASITVPVLKLVGLSYLLITGERGSPKAAAAADGDLPHRRFDRPVVDDRRVHDLDPHGARPDGQARFGHSRTGACSPFVPL